MSTIIVTQVDSADDRIELEIGEFDNIIHFVILED